MKVLLIGNGQLGRAISRRLTEDSVTRVTVPWTDPAKALSVLQNAVFRFITETTETPTFVLWCAGVGMVASSQEALETEKNLFNACLSTASEVVGGCTTSWFLASSAGGIYAGNSELCDESTEPLPTSAYGRMKLEMEHSLTDFASRNSCNALIGRISNLYGPDQNFNKPQGFVGHLLNATAHRNPFRFSVPASTVRDFVFTDDVAALVSVWMRTSAETPGIHTKILGSFQSTTLAQVTRIAAHVTRLKPQVLFAPVFDGAQPSMVRLHSNRLTNLDRQVQSTSIDVGIWLTWQSVLTRTSRGGLSGPFTRNLQN
jgi:UDP-glucose 4-epimerase